MYINKRVYKKNNINNLSYNKLNKQTDIKYQKNFKLFKTNQLNKKNSNDDLEVTILPTIEEDIPKLSLIKTFEQKFKRLEQKPLEYFISKYDNYDINDADNFLYHGIRFQNHLEKLENIIKDKAILAGNYQEDYYSYNDNCNNGEYISLTTIDAGIVYKTFIIENISLLITSECKAIKTIYLPYEEWNQIKDIKTKNRYSYANGEYQVKQIIPLDLVKGIGLPSNYLKEIKKEYLIDIYLNDILNLMRKYNIDLPIVDTSYYNRPIYIPKDYQSKRKILKNK